MFSKISFGNNSMYSSNAFHKTRKFQNSYFIIHVNHPFLKKKIHFYWGPGIDDHNVMEQVQQCFASSYRQWLIGSLFRENVLCICSIIILTKMLPNWYWLLMIRTKWTPLFFFYVRLLHQVYTPYEKFLLFPCWVIFISPG